MVAGSERTRSMLGSAVVLGLVVATVSLWIGRDDPTRGVAVAVAGVLLGAALLLPQLRRGRHTPWATARERVAPGHAVVLWKPGCPYCERLLRALGGDARVTWVNVWADEDANAEVRRHHGGDELVPTALVGGRILTNPSAGELLEALEGASGG